MNNDIFLIILLVTILIISGCKQVIEEEAEPIKIGMNVWPGYAHAIIAAERGFFKEDGLNVDINVVKEYSDNVQLFEDENLDGIFEVYTDAITQAAKGIPLKVVYVSDFSSGGDVVISKPEIRTVADLKGKIISVEEFNGFSHIFVLELLRKSGLQESDVTLVELLAHEVANALESGTIDAGHTWEPTQSEAIAKGNRLLATSADTPGIITDVLVFRKEFVEKRPNDVKKIVKNLFKALEFLDTDENAAFAIMAEGTGVTPGSLKEGILGVKHLNLQENKQAFTQSEGTTSLYTSGKFISDFFVENGVISKPVNVGDILAPEIVNNLE